jgi:hypothetical protein
MSALVCHFEHEKDYEISVTLCSFSKRTKTLLMDVTEESI